MRVATLHFATCCNEHQETEDETQGLWENSGSIHVAFCFYSCSSGTLELEMQMATSISSPNAYLTSHPTTSATPDGTQRMFSVLKIRGSRSHARKTWYIPARKSPQNMIIISLNHCNVSDIACHRSTPKKLREEMQETQSTMPVLGIPERSPCRLHAENCGTQQCLRKSPNRWCELSESQVSWIRYILGVHIPLQEMFGYLGYNSKLLPRKLTNFPWTNSGWIRRFVLSFWVFWPLFGVHDVSLWGCKAKAGLLLLEGGRKWMKSSNFNMATLMHEEEVETALVESHEANLDENPILNRLSWMSTNHLAIWASELTPWPTFFTACLSWTPY